MNMIHLLDTLLDIQLVNFKYFKKIYCTIAEYQVSIIKITMEHKIPPGYSEINRYYKFLLF